jgi:hypothetical protein
MIWTKCEVGITSTCRVNERITDFRAVKAWKPFCTSILLWLEAHLIVLKACQVKRGLLFWLFCGLILKNCCALDFGEIVVKEAYDRFLASGKVIRIVKG